MSGPGRGCRCAAGGGWLPYGGREVDHVKMEQAEVHRYVDLDHGGTHDVPIVSGTLGRVTVAGAKAWSSRTAST